MDRQANGLGSRVMLAATTNGAAAVTAETSTNAVMTQGFAFDASTAESVKIHGFISRIMERRNRHARFHWFSSATGVAFGKFPVNASK